MNFWRAGPSSEDFRFFPLWSEPPISPDLIDESAILIPEPLSLWFCCSPGTDLIIFGASLTSDIRVSGSTTSPLTMQESTCLLKETIWAGRHVPHTGQPQVLLEVEELFRVKESKELCLADVTNLFTRTPAKMWEVYAEKSMLKFWVFPAKMVKFSKSKFLKILMIPPSLTWCSFASSCVLNMIAQFSKIQNQLTEKSSREAVPGRFTLEQLLYQLTEQLPSRELNLLFCADCVGLRTWPL